MFLIKILKENSILESKISDENKIRLNKLKLHDELKNVVINKLLGKNEENHRKFIEMSAKQTKALLVEVKIYSYFKKKRLLTEKRDLIKTQKNFLNYSFQSTKRSQTPIYGNCIIRKEKTNFYLNETIDERVYNNKFIKSKFPFNRTQLKISQRSDLTIKSSLNLHNLNILRKSPNNSTLLMNLNNLKKENLSRNKKLFMPFRSLNNSKGPTYKGKSIASKIIKTVFSYKIRKKFLIIKN